MYLHSVHFFPVLRLGGRVDFHSDSDFGFGFGPLARHFHFVFGGRRCGRRI